MRPKPLLWHQLRPRPFIGCVAPVRWCESEMCKTVFTRTTAFSPTMFRTLARTVNIARPLSSTPAALAGLVFRMPAMSPTMTEGGVVSWKFQPGEAFAAGDVLLEVETDKATIDVETTDDGVMWEILVNDGATGIPVGQPIAFLAEEGDDLATMAKPALDAPKAAEPKKEAAPEPKAEAAPEPKSPAKSESLRDGVFGPANPKQTFFPSVALLLHKHNISAEDAYAQIPASGPKGRILLGDVLAYLGTIDQSAVTKVTNYIKHKEHLDLSNIKLAAPKAAAPAKETPPPAKPKNILRVEFTSELGDGVSREKFQFAFERALEAATRQTYATRFPEYARAPVASTLYEDDIFDDLLVAPVSQDRFEVFDVSYQFIGEASGVSSEFVDDFDELLGVSQPATATFEAASPISAVVSFGIKYNDKLTDSQEFVEFFQDALLSQIPSKQLIIHT